MLICLRCGCQFGAVGRSEKRSKEFQCGETICTFSSPKPKFSAGSLELGLTGAVGHGAAKGPWALGTREADPHAVAPVTKPRQALTPLCLSLVGRVQAHDALKCCGWAGLAVRTLCL